MNWTGRGKLPPLVTLVAFGLAGCGAVYPELSTPVRGVADGVTPPPPDNLVYVDFKAATIPARTRDGRQWDSIGGNAPDPFAKLILNGKELIRTPVQSDTLTPNWPDQERANYWIPRGSTLELELWDSNAITNRPICVERVTALHDEVEAGELSIECDSGARVVLTVRPARARVGLGLYYELRGDEIYVTRLLTHSPAARAGLRAGDRILRIQGKDVAHMEDGEARSVINVNARTGLNLTVLHRDGSRREVTVREGAVYPLPHEGVSL